MSEKLKEHAHFTIDEITKFSKRRNYKGLKQWEKKLLFSAYEALGTPMDCRKCGLDKIMNIKNL